jgi:hypothetical protein
MVFLQVASEFFYLIKIKGNKKTPHLSRLVLAVNTGIFARTSINYNFTAKISIFAVESYYSYRKKPLKIQEPTYVKKNGIFISPDKNTVFVIIESLFIPCSILCRRIPP